MASQWSTSARSQRQPAEAHRNPVHSMMCLSMMDQMVGLFGPKHRRLRRFKEVDSAGSSLRGDSVQWLISIGMVFICGSFRLLAGCRSVLCPRDDRPDLAQTEKFSLMDMPASEALAWESATIQERFLALDEVLASAAPVPVVRL